MWMKFQKSKYDVVAIGVQGTESMFLFAFFLLVWFLACLVVPMIENSAVEETEMETGMVWNWKWVENRKHN